MPFINAREYFNRISLVALGDMTAGPRPTAVEIGLNIRVR
jgi:hypothetical protein